MSVCVIVNPKAAAGRASRAAAHLTKALDQAGILHAVHVSERPAHATQLARQAMDSGAPTILVVGGDGTLNEVAQAYLDDDGQPRPGPNLALLPAGTGGDFARGCDLDGSVAGAVARLREARARSLDLGVLRLAGPGGTPVHHAFVNVASVGISGAVDARVENGPKWLGGKAAFLLGTLSATLTYRNAPVEIHVDGQCWHRGRVLVVALGNGSRFGGGMQIAPEARWDDGLLDVVCVGDLERLQLLGAFSSIYSGQHLQHPQVTTTRARHVRIQTLRDEPALLVDADGQTPGHTPLEARLHAAALRLLV